MPIISNRCIYDKSNINLMLFQSYIESVEADSQVEYFKNFIMEFVILIASRFIVTGHIKQENMDKLSTKTLTRTMDLLSKYRNFVLEAMIGIGPFHRVRNNLL